MRWSESIKKYVNFLFLEEGKFFWLNVLDLLFEAIKQFVDIVVEQDFAVSSGPGDFEPELLFDILSFQFFQDL